MRNLNPIAAIALTLFLWCVTARAATPADKSDPELERQALKLPDGFEINLFAADPMIQKPIEMNFDADGRLWVATSVTYPQIKPGQEAQDRVVVLEDTTGSGKADKATVFADGLFLPTGIVPGDGGAYVANSTEILHLKDTTGGLHANQRRVVLSGFGTEDTHHIIHAFNWGPDGRIYFNQSIYIHSNIETPWGERRLQGSGTWRYRPETGQLEVYCRGQVNPWGIAWDYWGETFESDGAGFEGIAFAFPGSAFQSAVGFDHFLPGLNHGSPKYCSLAILDGRQMPPDYRGTFLTDDFRANRVCRFQITDQGSGVVSRQLPDFIVSKDVDFRPVDIKMGPDGAIYIADWYNPIINHGEVDFRDPRRDHIHGRIWRITAKGQPLVKRQKLAEAPVDELLEALRSPEQYTRMHAKQVMRERGAAAIVPSLSRWVQHLDPKNADTEHARVEALWAYESMDVIEPRLLETVLHSSNEHARAAGMRVLSHWATQIPNALELMKAGVDDESARVRLEAVRALVAIPSAQAAVIAARVLDHPMDTYLDFALWRTNVELEPAWMPAFNAGKLNDWEKPSHLARALKDVKSPAAIDALVQQLRTGQLDDGARAGIVNLIASIDSPKQVQTLFDIASTRDGQDAATRRLAIDALERIVREHRPGEDYQASVKSLMKDSDAGIRASAVRLAGALKLEAMRDDITTLAASTDQPQAIRLSAISALGDLGTSQSAQTLEKLDEKSNPITIREQAIEALTQVDLPEASRRATDILAADQPRSTLAALLKAFVSRADGADELAKAISAKHVTADAAKLSLRALQTLGTDQPSLVNALREAAGFSQGPTKLSPDQMKQMIEQVMAHGDAVRGQRVFRSREASCYQCHAISGAGGFLAPDLSSIGASSPMDYIVDSVLDPNKAIKDGFQGHSVLTRDGQVISGIKVREDSTSLVLRDATRPEIVIPRSSIKAERDIGSLMPIGLADALTQQEFLDLVRFLSELGKPGPFAPSPAQWIRRWRIMEAPPTNVIQGDLPATIADAGSNWLPAYSLVSGELPPDALRMAGPDRVGYCRAELQVSGSGKVRLRINSIKGLAIWIDGKHADPATEMDVELSPGTHALVFALSFAQRGSTGLGVEIEPAPGSAAHAQPVTGM